MNHLMKCHYCLKSFRAFRKDARFCSDSCRVSYSKLPITMQHKAAGSWKYMVELLELARRFPEKVTDAGQQINWLKDRIKSIEADLSVIEAVRKDSHEK